MNRFLFYSFALLLLSLPTSARAQPADVYFHDAGQEYIGNALDEALATVSEGLDAYPDDAKLQALKEKLEEERQNQEQQGQGGEGEQEPQEQESEPDEQRGEEQQNEGEPDEQEEGEEEQEQTGSGEQEGGEEQDEPPQPAPQDPTELSREQAERILQALSNEEEELLRQVQKLPVQPRPVEKDW